MKSSQLIVAFDQQTNLHECLSLVDRIGPLLSFVKIGSIAFSAMGPSILKEMHARGLNIFLDLKYHDIPNTVSQAIDKVTDHAPLSFISLHGVGGKEMIESSRSLLEKKFASNRPFLLAITILTSLHEKQLHDFGFDSNLSMVEMVKAIGKKSVDAGVDGLVCSGFELEMLRTSLGSSIALVVPGIRLTQETHDQKRVMSPAAAMKQGASHLVLGRAVTESKDPRSTFESLCNM
ncbi:MAG: orotidine-5'-phosphate decarboxylase [Bdellovibrionota bacterium]